MMIPHFEIELIEHGNAGGFAPEIKQITVTREETTIRHIVRLEDSSTEDEAVQVAQNWLRGYVSREYGDGVEYTVDVFSDVGFFKKIRAYLANEEPRQPKRLVDKAVL